MTDTSIQSYQPGSGALSAEHYQTFEMAKENDGILGGSDIAEIRSYAAFARAQAQAVHKSIAAMNELDDVTATKAEMTETAQTFAKVGIYADQRIGEILRGMEQAKRGPKVNSDVSEKTKADAIAEAGIPKSQAYDLQKLAANPDVVQAVLDKAEAEGRIPSRKQVLDAIRERDEAREDNVQYQRDVQELQEEIAALEKQNDKAYEDGYRAASHNTQPQVVTREVESEASKKRISDLEHERDVYLSDVQKLRKRNEDLRGELDKAKDMLGMDKTIQDVRKDVQYLTNATNQYVRQYGGLTWTAASFERVEPQALAELRTAAINLATFANALVASLEDFNG